MGRDNIEKFSIGYAFLKNMVKVWHNFVYYRKVIVLGRENINTNNHNIFAPNHQNALMDALAVTSTAPGQPIFLARSDVFRKKRIASLLYYFKMLPVFRIRDGYESLRHNDEIFNKTIDVILNRNGLVILPEGNHAGFRRLRQLKKGICRIAFQTEEEKEFKLGLKIIPVGLEFSHYWKFRQILTINYGEPIGFEELYDTYRESPQIALNKLREKISAGIKKVIVHIESEDDYEALNEIRDIVNGKHSRDRGFPKIYRDKELLDRMESASQNKPELYREICSKVLKIKDIASRLNVGYFHLEKSKPRLITHLGVMVGLIGLFPVFLYGFIFNYIFFGIPKVPLRSIKDEAFHSSIRFVISLALGIVFFPIYILLAFLFIPGWWLPLLVLISIPFTGLFAWNYFLIWQKFREGVRVRKYINRDNPEYRILTGIYKELGEDLKKL
jgi:1-acyl-sn-glycerol-3-phosphate acyltransferase